MIHELFEVLQVVPPREEEGLCNETEPGRDLQFFALGLLQHLLQLLFAHITVAFDLIGVWIQVQVLWRGIRKSCIKDNPNRQKADSQTNEIQIYVTSR